MYQSTRYIHKNGVSRVNSITVFENDAQKAAKIAEESQKVVDCTGYATPSGGVPTVYIMDAAEALDTYGVVIPEDTKNVVGVCFHTEDLNLVRAHLDGFKTRQCGNSIVVDMMEEMNVYLVFTEE